MHYTKYNIVHSLLTNIILSQNYLINNRVAEIITKTTQLEYKPN